MAKVFGFSDKPTAAKLRDFAASLTSSVRSPIPKERGEAPRIAPLRSYIVILDEPIDAAFLNEDKILTLGVGVAKVYRRAEDVLFSQDPSNEILQTLLIKQPDESGGELKVRIFNPFKVQVPADIPIEVVQDNYGDLYVYGAASAVGVLFKNTSGEEVPPHGVMYVVGAIDQNGVTYLEITKPSAVLDRFYLVNGPEPVPDTEFGTGSWLSESGRAAYDKTETAITTSGVSYGVQKDSWLLKYNREGFTCLANPTEIGETGFGTDVADFRQHEIKTVFGKVVSSDEGASSGLKVEPDVEFGTMLTPGKVKVWMKNESGIMEETDFDPIDVDTWMMGPFADSTATPPVVADDDIEVDTRVICQYYSGVWQLAQARCSPDTPPLPSGP